MHGLVTALPPALVLWGMIMRVMSEVKITVKVEWRD